MNGRPREFKKGEYYVVRKDRKECWKNKGKFIKPEKDKKGGQFLHVRWVRTHEEDYIPQYCIEREAQQDDEEELMVELI